MFTRYPRRTILGRLFDSVGRKPMIAGTYILSGVLLRAPRGYSTRAT